MVIREVRADRPSPLPSSWSGGLAVVLGGAAGGRVQEQEERPPPRWGLLLLLPVERPHQRHAPRPRTCTCMSVSWPAWASN